jgi:hypothetical protein
MFSKSHTSNRSFPCTKPALEALQEIRIKHRWEAYGYKESIHITSQIRKLPQLLSNGIRKAIISQKPLFTLYKSRESGPLTKKKEQLLFELYPDIKQLTLYPSNTQYFTNNDKNVALC